MMTVDDILDGVLKAEGGFVDDPNDGGGATNRGVSLRYAKGIGLDLDHDGDTDVDDIKLVDEKTARELYKHDFFTGPGIDTLPAALHPCMLDFAVNSGAPRAIMTLQQVLNRVGAAAPDLALGVLTDDGRMGPKTRIAAEKAYQAMGGYLVNALCAAREDFLMGLATLNPDRYGKYVKAANGGPGGWITRARSFKVAV